MELKDKGVAPEIIDQTLLSAEVDWDELLRVQHNRKFGTSKAGSFKEWARRAQYLGRRGFSTDTIRRVMGSWDGAASVRDDTDVDINA
jgi:regulatory protein